MFSRISDRFIAMIAVALAGCGSDEQTASTAPVVAPTIDCALDGAAAFERRCSLRQQGETLTLSDPGGGFRRLRIVPGGVEAADGAETAQVTPLKDMIEVRIGDDAYRLRAQIE